MHAAEQPSPPLRGGIPLAALLLAVVVVLVGAVAGAVIFENYRSTVAVTMDIGRQQFDNLRTEIALEQQQLLAPLNSAVTLFARDPALGRGTAAELAPQFLSVLEANPQITQLRVVYDDGDEFAMANLGDSAGRLRKAIGAPDDAVFAERRVARKGNMRELTWSYIGPRNEDLSGFSTELPLTTARPEPWLTAAEATPTVTIQSKAAVIPSFHAAGVTFAAAFRGQFSGVVSTDVSLGQLSRMLASLKSSADDEIFMFDADGTLLASADFDPVTESDNVLKLAKLDALDSPVAEAMEQQFHDHGAFALDELDVKGTRFLASVIRIGAEDDARPPVYLGLALPDTTFTGRFIAMNRDSLMISFLILLAAVPLAIFIARRLAQPLSRLQRITDGIARLDMTQDATVSTHVREIAGLSRSIGHMRNALGEMAKFVPKSLVQDLLASGTQLAVGGERRELSLMFSDVRGFTEMVEAAKPDDVMAQMSEYFDALAAAIIAEHGTIDKYIGDAVFAFWNAPVRHENHTALACRAVLAARDASEVLNQTWKAAGKPCWHTCFSIHVGEAVVGNVGARDRLNYTAIGSAVNMAARLEGLNKFYRTQILVSADTVSKAGDAFRFRPIDLVLPKGATQPLMIHELLGFAHKLTPSEEEHARIWERFYASYAARDWRRAYAIVVDVADAYPQDPVAELFRDRVAKFLANPPSATWDGATRFETK